MTRRALDVSRIDSATAQALGVERMPFMTAHTGHDSWPLAAAAELLGAASEAAAARSGVLLAHETHRGRALFSPWAVRGVPPIWPDLLWLCFVCMLKC